MDIIYGLLQSTIPIITILLIVSLGGLVTERSGVTNIALEGIMVIGAFLGIWAIQSIEVFPFTFRAKVFIFIVSILFSVVLSWIISLFFVKLMKSKTYQVFKWEIKRNKLILMISLLISIILTIALFLWITSTTIQLHFILIMGMMIGGFFGGLYSMIHAYASINLKANQIISATALNLFAISFAIFMIESVRAAAGEGVNAVISFSSRFQIEYVPYLSDIPVIGDIFFKNTYVSLFIVIFIFGLVWIILDKTKFGLRLRACGENPHAADSLGINIYRIRFIAVTISGIFAGIGGVLFVIPTAGSFTISDGVAGYGFLAIAVLIFGNWRPLKILFAVIFFSFMQNIAAFSDVIPFLSGMPNPVARMLPFVATLIVLAFSSKRSRVPKALGQIYDQGKR